MSKEVLQTIQTKRVALYARVSGAEQQQGKTIDSQIYENEEFCSRQDLEIIKHYKDDGWSGGFGTDERPAIYDLLKDAKDKRFDIVVCNEVSRLARDVGVFSGAMKQLAIFGIKVLFVKQQVDDTPAGKLSLNVMACFAEHDRAVILERTQRGKIYKVKVKKQYIGSIPSYGYKYIHKNKHIGEEGHYEINPEEAKVVQMIFSWVRDGMSAREVVRQLTEMRIPTRKHLPRWAKSSVIRILGKEDYLGKFWYNRRQSVVSPKPRAEGEFRQNPKTGRIVRPKEEWLLVEYPHLRIVEDATFAAVQERLKKNLSFAKRNIKNKYLLSGGLMKCGKCGCSYYGDTFHGSPFYKDSNKTKKFPLPRTCDMGSISAKKIEPLVWKVIVRLLRNPKFLMMEIEKNRDLLESEGNQHKSELILLEDQLLSFNSQEERLVTGYQQGVLTQEQAREPLVKVRGDKKEIEAKIATLKKEVVSAVSVPEAKMGVEEFCKQVQDRLSNLTFEEKQELLRLVLKEVIFNREKVLIRGFIPIIRQENQNDTKITNIKSGDYDLRRRQ